MGAQISWFRFLIFAEMFFKQCYYVAEFDFGFDF